MTRNGCCTCTIQLLDANENWLNETIVARWPVKGIIHYSFKSSILLCQEIDRGRTKREN